MSTFGLLMAAPALGLVLWAAAQDLHSRRIPNWLTFSLMLSGIAQSFTGAGSRLTTPSMSLAGFAVGFTLPLILFLLGAVRGGDVKLMAGIGAWFGPGVAFGVFVIQALIGA